MKVMVKVGDRVLAPGGPAVVRSVYNVLGRGIATVVHDDPKERGIDGYMIYWTEELEVLGMEDITGALHVEVTIRGDGRVLWVNTEQGCVLRICAIKNIEILDERPKGLEVPNGEADRRDRPGTEGP